MDERKMLDGCSDGNCVIVKPVGMHTNGGCKCLRYPENVQKFRDELAALKLQNGEFAKTIDTLREAVKKEHSDYLQEHHAHYSVELMRVEAEKKLDNALAIHGLVRDERDRLEAQLKESNRLNLRLQNELGRISTAAFEGKSDGVEYLQLIARNALSGEQGNDHVCASCLQVGGHKSGCHRDRQQTEKRNPAPDPFGGCAACGAPKLCPCGHPMVMHRPKCFWVGLCGCETELPPDLVAQAVATEKRKCPLCGRVGAPVGCCENHR